MNFSMLLISFYNHFKSLLLTLNVHEQECYSSHLVCVCVCVFLCVCESVKSHLISGASVHPENTVTCSAGN